jgi:D-alanyl-lipoteichoic acid acyltransferase DltB (MBOAT superfamily)
MSYVIDIYRGKGKVQKNPLNAALYITLFPQLIAGPIVRYETIAGQINHRSFNLDDFSLGVKRFIIGLSKKVIIANTVAIIADRAFNPAGVSDLTILMAWLGIISYTLQIYFDFSGYSDMAIGLGLMFGFYFNENFDYPYISKSVTEFWRRWHISLGMWFRDYVYFPLGGSRVEKKSRLVFNLFIVWILTGIWHGASWNFIFWGFFYFVLLTFEKISGIPKKLEEKGGIFPQLYRIFTIFCVMLGWIFFRADGLKNGAKYVFAMFGGNGKAGIAGELAKFLLWDGFVILIAGIIACIPIVRLVKEKLPSMGYGVSGRLKTAKQLVISALFIICISYLAVSSYNPFIYFNF